MMMGAGNDHRSEGVRAHLVGSAEVKRRMAATLAESILAAADLLTDMFRAGGKVLLCGNGGSAGDCQHLAAEFVNRLTKGFDRPGLPAIALTTDTSFLTAFANDFGFERVFERQVHALGRPGDALIGISTSGNSANVIRAVDAAHASGMRTIALTGMGGRLAGTATLTISVPSDNPQYIQEAHLAIEHIVCDLVEHDLFGEHRRRGGQDA
jgi:D-sedoheptulose 7-phosphate isomerase